MTRSTTASVDLAATIVIDGLLAIARDPVAARDAAVALTAIPGIADYFAREAGLEPDPWLDSRAAAGHVGLTLDAFKKVCHRIASAQDAPGCKRYWRRSALDAWRLDQVG